MLPTLDAYIDRLSGLEPAEKDRLFEEAKQIIGSDIWIPNPGLQPDAFALAEAYLFNLYYFTSWGSGGVAPS